MTTYRNKDLPFKLLFFGNMKLRSAAFFKTIAKFRSRLHIRVGTSEIRNDMRWTIHWQQGNRLGSDQNKDGF